PRREQLFPGAELDPRPAERRPAFPLRRVDRLPARVGHARDAALREELLERLVARPLGPAQPPFPRVLEQQLDGLRRVLLVRPDHAARAALDPAGAVDAGKRRAVLAEDAPARVRHRPAPLVERNAGQADTAIADAPEDRAAGNRLALARRDGADLTTLVRDELVPDDLDRLDPLLAEDRDRRDLEAEAERLRLAGRPPGRELAQDLDVATRPLSVLLERSAACRIELELLRVDG